MKYCDYSIPFEALLIDPDEQLRQLFRVVDVEPVDLEALKGTIVGPPLGKWREYADEAWFRAHEASCEAVLADFLGLEGGPGSTAPASRTELASRIVVG